MLNSRSTSIEFKNNKSRPIRFTLINGALSIILIFSLLFSALFSSAVSASGSDSSGNTSDGTSAAGLTAAAASGTQTPILDPNDPDAPAIDGTAYVLYDVQSGTFLLGNNQDTPLAPASITKVMTVLLAFENLKLTDTITVTRDMYESIPADYVRLGLVEGEEITVEQALYACLLISANDAAMALAIKMGGSVDGFSDMMNAKALELGCTQTHFTNPYGLADELHLTSAHDMALIMAAAIENNMYTKISTTANYTIPATNKFNQPRSLTNANRFVSTTEYAYENYVGGKTGFNDLSAYTICAGAKLDGRTLIGVVLGASCSEVRYTELISLFSYGFKHFSTSSVDPSEFDAVKQQVVDQVSTAVSGAGYSLQVTNAAASISPFCTTMAAGSYVCTADISHAVIQAGVPTQVLDLPLCRQYSDGTSVQVGTLSLTLSDSSVASSASSAETDKEHTGMGTILLRIGIVIFMTAIIGFSIVFFVMLQNEKKRRRSTRRPNIL